MNRQPRHRQAARPRRALRLTLIAGLGLGVGHAAVSAGWLGPLSAAPLAQMSSLEPPTPSVASADPARPLLDGVPLPPVPDDAAPGRLRPAVDPGPGGTYAFTEADATGAPVRVDPCRPVHYVVRAGDLPAAALEAIRTAVGEVEQLTGLSFVEDGAVDEGPTPDRAAIQPGVYGNRWAPVLISWSSPQEYPALAGAADGSSDGSVAGPVAGLGGAVVVDVPGGRPRIVSGSVVLNAETLDPLLATTQGRRYVELVMMHELGHAVGLAHVSEEAALMFDGPLTASGPGAGDRAGFALAGLGECHDDT